MASNRSDKKDWARGSNEGGPCKWVIAGATTIDIDLCAGKFQKFRAPTTCLICLKDAKGLGNMVTVRNYHDFSAASKFFRSYCTEKFENVIWLSLPEHVPVAPANVECTYEGPGIPLVEIAHAALGPEYARWPSWSVWKFDWRDILRVFTDDDLDTLFDNGNRQLKGCCYAAATDSYEHTRAHNSKYYKAKGCQTDPDEVQKQYDKRLEDMKKWGIDFPPTHKRHFNRRWRFLLIFTDGNVLEFHPDWNTLTAEVAWVTEEHCTALAASIREPSKGAGRSRGPGSFRAMKKERVHTIKYRSGREMLPFDLNHGPLYGYVPRWTWNGGGEDMLVKDEKAKRKRERQKLYLSSEAIQEAVNEHNEKIALDQQTQPTQPQAAVPPPPHHRTAAPKAAPPQSSWQRRQARRRAEQPPQPPQMPYAIDAHALVMLC